MRIVQVSNNCENSLYQTLKYSRLILSVVAAKEKSINKPSLPFLEGRNGFGQHLAANFQAIAHTHYHAHHTSADALRVLPIRNETVNAQILKFFYFQPDYLPVLFLF